MQIHRFHETAAISPDGKGETRYMNAAAARQLAAGLVAIADSIEREQFSAAPCLDSTVATYPDAPAARRAQ